uniref:Nose resistant-to-fluoxetine protein N-terminal domain-containing protein n=1 Tax=Syphacia muris TaxID=451379 RepID=A0A0N5A8K1_9BILA
MLIFAILQILLLFVGYGRCTNKDFPEVKATWLRSLKKNVSEPCTDAFEKLERYFLSSNILIADWIFYKDSFGLAFKNEPVADSGFFYRMMECFAFSGETPYSESQNPVYFCYGPETGHHLNAQLFSSCIPTPCINDSVTILDNWKSIIAPRSEKISDTDVRCVRSRHTTPWYREKYMIFALFYFLISYWILIFATVYHFYRGPNAQ